ncbi:MAG: DUF1803 domain-containing protein [Lactococcus sp.]|nr:DUF1803 domain-containing protein [Lactococcus sp.]
MSIKIFNHTKLTETPFFQALITFLANHEDVTLRSIKAAFNSEKNLERQIENFVQAGLISRLDKRYTNNFQVFGDEDFALNLPVSVPKTLIFADPFFVVEGSELMAALNASQMQQTLSNQTNSIQLHLASNFARTDDSLANYFYHVEKRVALSVVEQEVFDLIGDIDPEYALKYMTTFLLKFLKKDIVKNKKPDIFVQALIVFGYIHLVSEDNYQSALPIIDQTFDTVSFDAPKAFIAEQLKQREQVENFMSL